MVQTRLDDVLRGTNTPPDCSEGYIILWYTVIIFGWQRDQMALNGSKMA